MVRITFDDRIYPAPSETQLTHFKVEGDYIIHDTCIKDNMHQKLYKYPTIVNTYTNKQSVVPVHIEGLNTYDKHLTCKKTITIDTKASKFHTMSVDYFLIIYGRNECTFYDNYGNELLHFGMKNGIVKIHYFYDETLQRENFIVAYAYTSRLEIYDSCLNQKYIIDGYQEMKFIGVHDHYMLIDRFYSPRIGHVCISDILDLQTFKPVDELILYDFPKHEIVVKNERGYTMTMLRRKSL